ncbi:Origin recognition complex subunit 5, partial [Rhizophlyctis rosea]
VFDKAERLRDMSPTLLPSLLKLQEQTRTPLTVILLSHLPWSSLLTRTPSIDPTTLLIIPFTPYTKPTILSIMARDCPPSEDTDFFLKFVEMIYDVFQRPCKDLNELRHLVALLFPKYVEPVLAGKVTRQQTGKLFANIQFYIKETLHSIYLREISSSEWQKTSENKNLYQSVVRPALYDVELPFYTKFLLIASFLASYNPPRLDVRYFSRTGDDRKKRK